MLNKYPWIVDRFKWLLLSGIIAILVGSASALFLVSLDWVTQYRENHLWIVAFLPVAGFIAGWIYYHYGKDIESGNNLLIDNIHTPQRVPIKIAPFIYFSTLATHLFGGSGGREGAALQMAGGLTNPLNSLFKLNQSEKKILLIAAISAGFGSIFGTPLAGAVFGLEVFLIGKVRYEALFPAFMSSILANWITLSWGIQHSHYVIPMVPEWSFSSLWITLSVGVVFGLVARGFSWSMHKTKALFKKHIAYPPFQPVIGGVIVIVLLWVVGFEYAGLGLATIQQSFDSALPIHVFAFKILLTVFTLASGFKGGEVTPLFFIGATLGSALAGFFGLPTGLVAGMGFAAVFAAATNAPLACILMGIELFGVQSASYIALACVVAYLSSGHTGIYSTQIVGSAKHPHWQHHEGEHLTSII